MATRTEGVIAKMKREERNKGINEGFQQGQRNIILQLLKEKSLSEVSKLINKKESEIEKIIEIE